MKPNNDTLAAVAAMGEDGLTPSRMDLTGVLAPSYVPPIGIAPGPATLIMTTPTTQVASIPQQVAATEPRELMVNGSGTSIRGNYYGWTWRGIRPANWNGLIIRSGSTMVRMPAEMVHSIVSSHIDGRKLVCRKAARKTAVNYYVKEII